MQHFIKMYEEIKKINGDVTQYEFSSNFLHKKRSYFASLKQRTLYLSQKTLVQLSHTYSNLTNVVKDEEIKYQNETYTNPFTTKNFFAKHCIAWVFKPSIAECE